MAGGSTMVSPTSSRAVRHKLGGTSNYTSFLYYVYFSLMMVGNIAVVAGHKVKSSSGFNDFTLDGSMGDGSGGDEGFYYLTDFVILGSTIAVTAPLMGLVARSLIWPPMKAFYRKWRHQLTQQRLQRRKKQKLASLTSRDSIDSSNEASGSKSRSRTGSRDVRDRKRERQDKQAQAARRRAEKEAARAKAEAERKQREERKLLQKQQKEERRRKLLEGDQNKPPDPKSLEEEERDRLKRIENTRRRLEEEEAELRRKREQEKRERDAQLERQRQKEEAQAKAAAAKAARQSKQGTGSSVNINQHNLTNSSKQHQTKIRSKAHSSNGKSRGSSSKALEVGRSSRENASRKSSSGGGADRSAQGPRSQSQPQKSTFSKPVVQPITRSASQSGSRNSNSSSVRQQQSQPQQLQQRRQAKLATGSAGSQSRATSVQQSNSQHVQNKHRLQGANGPTLKSSTPSQLRRRQPPPAGKAGTTTGRGAGLNSSVSASASSQGRISKSGQGATKLSANRFATSTAESSATQDPKALDRQRMIELQYEEVERRRWGEIALSTVVMLPLMTWQYVNVWTQQHGLAPGNGNNKDPTSRHIHSGTSTSRLPNLRSENTRSSGPSWRPGGSGSSIPPLLMHKLPPNGDSLGGPPASTRVSRPRGPSGGSSLLGVVGLRPSGDSVPDAGSSTSSSPGSVISAPPRNGSTLVGLGHRGDGFPLQPSFPEGGPDNVMAPSLVSRTPGAGRDKRKAVIGVGPALDSDPSPSAFLPAFLQGGSGMSGDENESMAFSGGTNKPLSPDRMDQPWDAGIEQQLLGSDFSMHLDMDEPADGGHGNGATFLF